MCAKCQANKAAKQSQFKKSIQTPCKYTLQELTDALDIVEGVLLKAWIQSAINVHDTPHCNKYNKQIDDLI